jgi:hypothetical protein
MRAHAGNPRTLPRRIIEIEQIAGVENGDRERTGAQTFCARFPVGTMENQGIGVSSVLTVRSKVNKIDGLGELIGGPVEIDRQKVLIETKKFYAGIVREHGLHEKRRGPICVTQLPVKQTL